MRKVIKRIFQGEREKKRRFCEEEGTFVKKENQSEGGVYLLFIEMIFLLQRE